MSLLIEFCGSPSSAKSRPPETLAHRVSRCLPPKGFSPSTDSPARSVASGALDVLGWMPKLRNSPASETVMTFATQALSASAVNEEYTIQYNTMLCYTILYYTIYSRPGRGVGQPAGRDTLLPHHHARAALDPQRHDRRPLDGALRKSTSFV